MQNFKANTMYLTIKSSGEAGKAHKDVMGVYQQKGEYHNEKPVWSRHDGTHHGPNKIFNGNGKFPFN